MANSARKKPVPIRSQSDEIVFPKWANEAYTDAERMDELRAVIRQQVENSELLDSWTHKNQDGSSFTASRQSHPDLYRKAIEDRVSGEINGFFNPIAYNQIKVVKRFIRSIFFSG